MEWFFLGGYIAVAIYLALATADWHVKHDSPGSYVIHDALIAVVWPADIAVRIYRAHR